MSSLWLAWSHRQALLSSFKDFNRAWVMFALIALLSLLLHLSWCFYCLSEERFQTMQEEFKDKHYHHFTDEEENKLIYTDIFKEYVSWFYSLGKRLELVLSLLYLLVSLSQKKQTKIILFLVHSCCQVPLQTTDMLHIHQNHCVQSKSMFVDSSPFQVWSFTF